MKMIDDKRNTKYESLRLLTAILIATLAHLAIASSSACGSETTGLIPITDMNDQHYKEQTGGLYGNGSNSPPEKHAAAAQKSRPRLSRSMKMGNPPLPARLF